MKALAIFMIVGALSLVFAQSPPPPSVPPETPAEPQKIEKADLPGKPVESGKAASNFLSESFIYDPTGKRDPFQPDSAKEQATEEAPGPVVEEHIEVAPTRPLEPLENYELGQLRVAAIIWNTKNPKAMVIDPSGGTHYLKVKSRVGKKNGFVAAIREGEVVVVEYLQENGQYTKTFKVLELR